MERQDLCRQGSVRHNPMCLVLQQMSRWCHYFKDLDAYFSTMPYHLIPYTIILYTIYTILYYTILYYTILYYTILYYTILYYTILYYILYYTILYYTILYYTILYLLHYSIHLQGKAGESELSASQEVPTDAGFMTLVERSRLGQEQSERGRLNGTVTIIISSPTTWNSGTACPLSGIGAVIVTARVTENG